MMNSQKRNRTHRPQPGSRVNKARGGSFEKNVLAEGIFTNPRFTYFATSLVGCCVQLQVKNGKCYEGILKTCSPKMDVVLEMAHKIDDTGGNNNIPSKELVQDKIIFNCCDILMIAATDVDLDYAVKDSFTDTAISKQNGVVDKEMRELTPWEPEDSEAHGSAGLHDGAASNGWDPNEMFSTNERQFNVKSTYDDSLHQYTVPLEKRDTQEYREKEERAAQLAYEIEKSEGYRQRLDVENSVEGDDEETKFSAVVRPEVSTAASNPGKYIPPGKRGQQRNLRHGPSSNMPNRMPVHQPPPQPTAPRLAPQQSREEVKVNGNEVKEEVKVEEKDIPNASPVPDSLSAGPDKPESNHTSPVSKLDKKNTTPKARTVLVQELKDFSSNFKLSDDSKESKKTPDKVEKVEPKEEEEKTKSPPPPPPPQPATAESTPPQPKEEPQEPVSELVKHSNLNPNAKTFVFQPKQHPQQVPTPPRPQTQSPIIQPMPPAMAPSIFPQVIFQTVPGQQIPQHTQQRPPPKRENGNKRPPLSPAVVSIQPPRTDFTAAAAQAATGAPLLAHTPYSQVQYTPFMMAQPASYQVGQVMPMPSAQPAGGPRLMTPPSGATVEMGQQPTGPLFMGPNGPVPAHMPHQTYHNPQPAHIGPHHGQQNQQPAGHPAPSPVQHVVTSTQSHPPTSNTPQPHNPYQQMSIQGHPPLQPSPHNPASPQTVHMPAVQYHQYTSHAHPLQMQGANNHVMSQSHIPTSATHTIHSHMQPQFVMMPHLHNQHNQQTHQFQPHHIAPGQSSMLPQAGIHTIQNTQPGTHQQFIPQVPPSQGAPHSIQNYQQNH